MESKGVKALAFIRIYLLFFAHIKGRLRKKPTPGIMQAKGRFVKALSKQLGELIPKHSFVFLRPFFLYLHPADINAPGGGVGGVYNYPLICLTGLSVNH